MAGLATKVMSVCQPVWVERPGAKGRGSVRRRGEPLSWEVSTE